MSLSKGTLLGPYEIQGVLGSGGMGEVYEALDRRLGRRVALKMLHPAFAANAEGLRRFEQEARATSALSHPNILTLHDLGTHEGAPFLVSELLEGETLRARMTGRPMAVGTALELALQVARGLAAAHGKGIVHRDLKPENLFLTRDGLVKILDFGIAKLRAPSPLPGSEDTANTLTAAVRAEASLTVDGRILGTVQYMSPEQVRAESLDGRSDLFSLGCVLWEMVTAVHPFQRPTPVETLSALLKDDPPELDPALRIPAGVERLLRRCLAKPVGARFQTAQDLAFALDALRGSGSELAPPALPRRWRPSRAAVRGGLAGLGLLGLGLLAALALRPDPGQPTYRRISFRQGLLYGARFSPDGREVLYGAAWSGDAWRVHVLPLDTLEERPVGPPEAQLLALSREGELALNLGIGARAWRFSYRGRLALAPKMGALTPKDAFADVEWADYGPQGQLAVVRIVGNRYRLEYPAGTVIAESEGWISHPRISPEGDAVAWIDHPVLNDDIGAVCLWRPGAGSARRLTPLWQGGARGLAWKGNEVWFTAGVKTGMRGIWAASPRGKVREVLQTPGDLLLQDVSADGRVLLVREDTRQGLVWGTRGDRAVHEFSLRDWTHLRSLSPDGQSILFEELSELGEQGYRNYLRRLDTRSTVRIGEGMLSTLSPDQAWVATIHALPSPHPVLLPVGPGEPRPLPAQGLRAFADMSWTADGNLLLVANEEGQAKRIFRLDRAGGRPRPLCPPGLGIEWHALAPDGGTLLFGDHHDAFRIDPREEGARPEPLRGWQPEDRFMAWSADSREIFTYRFLEDPIPIWRLDPATGTRRPWLSLDLKEFHAAALRDARITPDGRTWALRYRKVQTDLYLAEGLK